MIGRVDVSAMDIRGDQEVQRDEEMKVRQFFCNCER